MEKLLKKLKTDKNPWFGTKLSSEEVAIVIDALEKQIPMKTDEEKRKILYRAIENFGKGICRSSRFVTHVDDFQVIIDNSETGVIRYQIFKIKEDGTRVIL